jgi:hypothetical protein
MIKLFSFLLVLIVCVAGITVQSAYAASSAPDPFMVPDDQTLAITTYDECTKRTEGLYYDCKCLAMRYVDAKNEMLNRVFTYGGSVEDAKFTWNRDRARLRDMAQSACFDRASLAVQSFSQCRELNIIARADYHEYCSCYAVTFADMMAKSYGRLVERYTVMSEAMSVCEPARTRAIKARALTGR